MRRVPNWLFNASPVVAFAAGALGIASNLHARHVIAESQNRYRDARQTFETLTRQTLPDTSVGMIHTEDLWTVTVRPSLLRRLPPHDCRVIITMGDPPSIEVDGCERLPPGRDT